MIAGVVILYNPDNQTIHNISTYVHFLKALYVVDNSIIYNQKLIDYCNSKSNVVYVNNHGNLGVAKALNIAANASVSKQYKWLLTMDQDSYINDEGFFKSSASLMEKQNIGIIAASYTDVVFKPVASDFDGFIEVGAIITSGNLLNLKSWQEVRGFNEKLFIDEVDNEFCARLNNAGYKILASTHIYLEHNLGTKYSKKNILTGKQLSFTRHSPFRVYYITRNNLYFWRNYFFTNPAMVFSRIKNLAKLTYEITFYYPDKMSYYKKMAKGVFHFLISRYDEQ